MPRSRKGKAEKTRPVLHYLCEGEKTEPYYLKGYLGRKFCGPKIVKYEETDKNTPVELVEAALEMKKDCPEGDIFWVIFDRESQSKYPDQRHLEARQKAGTDVHIAISNVCFEMWLLLHFERTTAQYSNCDDLLKRSRLKQHIPDYIKACERKFSDAEINAARANAAWMNKEVKRGADPSWQHPHQINPFTNVHELLDAIDAFYSDWNSP